ncbi:MAG: TolC family protein [Ferruginibacter sp.]|nr:TolC family protein [Ferruginibacter sp.]
MKKTITLLFLCLLLFFNSGQCQETWNLRTVVDYAMKNNLGVKQSDIQARIAAITLKQSRADIFPSTQLGGGFSLNSGSNQDPTSFGRITETYKGASIQFQTSADIFNFFRKRNTILANEWDVRASKAMVDKQRYDIALAAANAYLQILLSLEQEKITLLQISQTTVQLNNTQKMVEAGSLPELNAVQLEAQLASDSVNYITTKGNTSLAILQLKALMDLDAALPFEIETPDVERIPIEPIAELQPEDVYALALINQPQQRVNDYRLKMWKYNLKSAKASMLPTFSGYGSLGSAYNNQALHITGVTPVNAPIGNVDIGGTSYQVFPITPFNSYSYAKTKFGQQLSDNFRQSIGLSINIPLFNGLSMRSNYWRSKLNYESTELQKKQDDQKLKQDIYQAYTAAITAMEKYNASKKNLSTNEVAYSFASKRYEVGMLNAFDLLTAQNNLFRARLENTISRFDYVFKMKVLEFYRGQGLKL